MRLRQTFVCHTAQTEAAESTCSDKAVLTLDAFQDKVIEKTTNLRRPRWAAHAGKYILDEAKARQGRLILLRQNARFLFDVVVGLGSVVRMLWNQGTLEVEVRKDVRLSTRFISRSGGCGLLW